MQQIKQLPQDLVNLIAAGEIVEHPLSIIKELVDNSLDAGATKIQIELIKGGIDSISVTDNGHGIPLETSDLIFERHATSKITSFEDLQNLLSRGYRGEALSAIGSVAKVRIETWNKKLFHYVAENHFGQLKKTEKLDNIPESGTKILVTNLFEKVPARKEFLKSPKYNLTSILRFVDQLASLLPKTHLSVFHEGRNLRNYLPEDLSHRMKEVSKHLFNGQELFPYVTENFKLFVAHPSEPFQSSNNCYLSVNQRIVRDRNLLQVLFAGLNKIIMPGLYPGFIFDLKIDPSLYDINISPNKSLVRFKNFEKLKHHILHHCEEFCRQTPWMKQDFGVSERNTFKPQESFSFERSSSFVFDRPKSVSLEATQELLRPVEKTSSSEAKAPLLSWEYLGQLHLKYLLFSSPAGLIFVDQHAAHEKIMFLKILREKLPTQELMEPLIANILGDDLNMEVAKKFGFELEQINENQWRIFAVPTLLKDDLEYCLGILSNKNKYEDILADLACKKAIRAGQTLERVQAEELVRELLELDYSSHCPHGRPVYLVKSLEELDREFLRHL